MRRRTLAAAVLPILLAARLEAASTVGAVLHPLNKHETDNTKNLITFADGPRLVPANGGIWFLEANADRIAYFANDAITEWPIRSRSYPAPYNHIGANPADFQLDADGTTVWFFENGTSGIELQQSVFGKLDTVTGEMTEWILPVSKPAGFLRDPDGETVWIAMSQGSLLKVDLSTLEATTFRASDSLGYSGLIPGPDGDFYLLDFGNNRVVRVDPATMTETAWTTLDPSKFRELPSQPTFDEEGNLLFAEDVDGGAIGRFNPVSGEFDRFAAGYLLSPSHFFLQGSLIYCVETDRSGGDGRVVVVDTTAAPKSTSTLTSRTETMTSVPSQPLQVRTFTLTPITFQSKDDPPDDLVVAAAPTTGVSRFTLPHGTNYPSTTSYSITVLDGKILAGVRGALVEFTLLPPASAEDLIVPLARNDSSGAIRTEFLFYNTKAATSTLDATFYDSPVPPPLSAGFSFAANQTKLSANALATGGLNVGSASGSLSFIPDANNTGGYRGLTRTYAVREDGGTYGYQLPAVPVSSGVTAGSAGALFFSAEESESTIFGIYSPTGAVGTATLHGPDGEERGSYSFFLPSNNRVEFDPGASAFGVVEEAGDFVTFGVTSGTIFPYAVFQQTTQDRAVALPVEPASDFVFPLLGNSSGANGQIVSEILLANADPLNAVEVNAAFYPLDPAAAVATISVEVPPGGSATMPFDSLAPGFGSVLIRSSASVCALARLARRGTGGDYAGVAPPVFAPGSGRFLVSGDSRLRRNLVLFNRGGEGTVTLQGYDDSDNPTGTLTLPVGNHAPLVLAHVAAALHVTGVGRIEVAGDPATRIYSWISAADNITGDPDIEGTLPP